MIEMVARWGGEGKGIDYIRTLPNYSTFQIGFFLLLRGLLSKSKLSVVPDNLFYVFVVQGIDLQIMMLGISLFNY